MHRNVQGFNILLAFFCFFFSVSGCGFISTFALLDGAPQGITSSAVGLNICLITAGVKNYNAIIEKNRKRNDKMVFLAKFQILSSSIDRWGSSSKRQNKKFEVL